MNKLKKSEWFAELVGECKAIVTEAVFGSRWLLVEGYHALGERIRNEGKKVTPLLKDLAVEINLSERTLWNALKLFDKYPQLDKLPEGKNITWNKLITKYLPDKKDKNEPCKHEWELWNICKHCKKRERID